MPMEKTVTAPRIDLLIDRRDETISICELKFSTSEFTIDKSYAAELQRKLDVFRETTKTRKTIFLVMVTTFGTKNNSYKTGLVQNEVVLEDLFER